MSPTKPDPFGPYPSPEELARGKRRAAVNLLVAAVAATLAVVAHRAVGDPRLVQTYLVAALLFLGAGLGPLVRVTRTGDFERTGSGAD
ncbi:MULTISPECIES: hypothetical protein [Nocardioides]|uniref:Uncharacterized protein n=1 Tax=Nocardioides vastitatis TaxID=2568655 RepID=A0ABW0ZB07_9ACTN|nr:hypothetical protein [Nocardioides sp.]THI96541.1 hypothetical protein E7Z54_16650 [Nocardioides sp.]